MESEFKFFNCDYLRKLGEIYVVVTGEYKENKIITEWYYFIKGNSIRGSGDASCPKGLFLSIEEFWTHETKPSLKLALYHDENIKDEKSQSLYNEEEIVLTEMNDYYIRKLYVDNPSVIKDISESTSCVAFKNFVKGLE